MRGVTSALSRNFSNFDISTHTPHARRDTGCIEKVVNRKEFQLTRLMRGVTDFSESGCRIAEISTHTPHARRDLNPQRDEICPNFISTHTPHARRDKDVESDIDFLINFNSHASCEA